MSSSPKRYFLIYNTVSGLRSFRLEQPTITVGSLPSNHLVLAGKNVEPIHCLLEMQTDGGWLISDLGSEHGVFINTQKIDVEAELKVGDQLKIGSVELHFEHNLKQDRHPHAATGTILDDQKQDTTDEPEQFEDSQDAQTLFDVDANKTPRGKILEIVAYWGDRVLEIEHFYKPSQKKNAPKLKSIASIGEGGRADFIAAGPKKIKLTPLAKVTPSGYTINLISGMKARLRRSGKIKQVTKAGKIKLSTTDIADIQYGPIRYFLLYVTLPKLKLPKHSPRDPLFLSLILFGTIFFLLISLVVNITPPSEKSLQEDDIWSIVGITQDVKPPKKEKPKVEKKPVTIKHKPKEKKKPIVPQIKPKPKPKPEPKKVVAKKKPQKIVQPKPTPTKKKLIPPKPPAKQVVTPAAAPASAPKKTLAKTPKPPAARAAAGGNNAKSVIATGKAKKGALGGGNNQLGGARKGTGSTSAPGVAGVSNKKAAGINLDSLGQNAGKIFNKAGAGAIATNFKSSGGGLGGGSGSASRTHGLGGSLTSGSALGLEGSDRQLNALGSGGGGLLDSGKGVGGSFNSGLGKNRGQIRVNVGNAGAPGISGGLTQEQVNGSIRANSNAIRYCYEQTLKQSPQARGKLTVQFVIGAGGTVISQKAIQNDIGPGLFDCVGKKIRTWRFPKPVGGQKVIVKYPWLFSPG
ncbi:MAG: AgmX/PglI C-terminal domain-containing protein [Proteobacteria bacterium]|nr:AgmX/PglI C-terminal domain-containing protein [Pseudomonadota bacterium]